MRIRWDKKQFRKAKLQESKIAPILRQIDRQNKKLREMGLMFFCDGTAHLMAHPAFAQDGCINQDNIIGELGEISFEGGGF